LTWFIRSKIWISPAPGINEPTANDPALDGKLNFAPEILQRFKDDPELLLQYRRSLMNRRIDNFKRTTAASEEQKKAQVIFRKSMEGRLGESEKGQELARMLIPSFPVGCRRQTPGPDFLEALLEPNVDARWDDIGKITEKGILTKSGEELEFDAIVCATGFDTSFRPRFPIIGRNGADLAKQWDAIPEAYFGLAVPNFPNYFSMLSPSEDLDLFYLLTKYSFHRT
jgi:cation diffusion facilitator CzcD-associated flavoprotein CzcO